MASALLTRSGGGSGPPVRSRSTEILCAGESFSIVVDDADDGEEGDQQGLGGSSRFGGSNSSIVEGEGEEELYYSKNKEVKRSTEKKLALFKVSAPAPCV